MTEASKNFNKKLIDQYGKIKVYVVDGEAVRNSSKDGEEFGEAGTHCFYPNVIPNNEIWIEDNINEQERKVLIASALVQIKSVDGGMSSDKAYEEGLKKEKDYRESLRQSRKNPLDTNKPAPDKLYIKKYGHIDGEDIDVWLVDGEKVRDNYKIDFIEGANPAVYGFCPNSELWVEKSPHPDEFPIIALHEFVEFVLMKYKKMKYDNAHMIASKVEWAHRNKKFSKEDALLMTKEKAMEMIKKFL